MTGAHLADLLGKTHAIPLSDLLGDELSATVVTWNVQTLRHGAAFADYDPGSGRMRRSAAGKVLTTADPAASEVLAVPIALIEEFLLTHGIEVPSRKDCEDWARAERAEGGDGTDPEEARRRAEYIVDPDLIGLIGPAEKRVCGVPQSIFDTLEPHEQKKVLAGRVISGPNSPLAVARYLARQHFAKTIRATGKGGRYRRILPRTLVRIDQTWYQYTAASSGDPERWHARTDPEWIGGELRDVLGRFHYVHTRRENKQNVYSLRWWNPTEKAISEVEKALAGLLSAGSGTHARELGDLYGWRRRFYADTGNWVLCRNGVLDVSTGTLRPTTPLWFSLNRIEADYDPKATYTDSRWLDTLRAQWSDDPDAITCLQQWFGYVLSGRNDLQRWMMVLGPKGSAKSLIATVLTALVGNVGELGLDSLNSPFGLQQTYETGASLAVMSDMRFGGRDTSMALGRLLAITGGDIVDVNRKHKVPVAVTLPVRFHGSANEMPRISDHSGALLSRMLVLETTQVFRGTDRDDPGLLRHVLTSELGQVLRWALDGLRLLDLAGGSFTVSAAAAELLDEIADDMSNVRQFVRDCCEQREDVYVKLPELFKVWDAWAAANKTGERMSQNAFRKALRSLSDGNATSIKPGQTKNDGAVVYGIATAKFETTHIDNFGGEVMRSVRAEAVRAARRSPRH
ncbi:phage/plasmid primase, P4 family [Gordonia terrae]|uniref:DNA primase family protein n=1 Tax=Gordonia hongkongensis TaxID=1701090 RepID=UPI0022B349BF|nr:phage/plasmid primase, P4 family [Gordonia terrae]